VPDDLQLHESADVETYAAAVTGFLEQAPVTRNVLLTVMNQARRGSAAWTRPPYFWWLTRAGTANVVAAASWTPPFPLLVSSVPTGGAAALAASACTRARSIDTPLRGVTGPRDSARHVAAALAQKSGAQVTERLQLIVHELRVLREVPKPPGAARAATADAATLIAEWMRAFNEEAHAGPGASIDTTVRGWIEDGRAWLWIDGGEPRSTTTQQPPAGGVVRIGAVYTPPQHRGRGYARRLVYETSASALAVPGVRACTLNTDAANPVSNTIYRQIGYVPVARHSEFSVSR
jgi:predicted GNAT family acetyltransferase